MNEAPKVDVAITPQSGATNATATGLIDGLGYNHCTITIWADSTDATTKQFTALKITECDTSDGTFADIVALTGGTATSTSVGFVIPASDTDSEVITLMSVSLVGRKRYLKVNLTPASNYLFHAIGHLTKGHEMPVSTTQCGVQAVVRG